MMAQAKYLNVYVYGQKKRLPSLLSAISNSIRDGWSKVEKNSTYRVSDDEIQEYRFTSNDTTGFLRFFCSTDQPYLLYLRDSGIIGADSPITLQDNDFLVQHFVKTVLKPACTEVDAKVQVTRALKH
ncbi:MAG: hypothetical protein K2Z81_14700 [Cyanobacteria bacterium]|nr:hypothetical protein [Cyanobacteriota bacterium]